jgi:hypothetical protein
MTKERGGEYWGAGSCEKEDKRVAGAAVLFSFLGSPPVQQKKLFFGAQGPHSTTAVWCYDSSSSCVEVSLS